jgi:hypothetical protein
LDQLEGRSEPEKERRRRHRERVRPKNEKTEVTDKVRQSVNRAPNAERSREG